MLRTVLLVILLVSLVRRGDASAVGDDCTAGVTICNTAGHFCDTGAEVGAANTCQLVPVNFYSVVNSGTKSACGTGYVTTSTGAGGNTAQEACICDLGYGRTINTNACVSCVAGYYKTASGDTVCTGCVIGKYYDTDLSYDATADQCGACGTAYSTSAVAATGPDIQTGCECATGYGRASNAAVCDICTQGSYKTTVGDTDCTDCAIGKYFDTDLSYDGTTDQCASCGTGYSTAAAGATGADIQTGCACDAGYARTSNSNPCTGCASASYKSTVREYVMFKGLVFPVRGD